MTQQIRNYLGVAIIAAIIFGIILGFWYVGAFSSSRLPQRTFSSSGEGKTVAVPDVAELTFGVLTEGGKNLAALQKENTDKITSVMTFLKESGIDEKDIRTQSYNITPRYQYFSCPPVYSPEEFKPCPPSEIVGYAVNQSILVKIRDLGKTGDVAAGVVERGANTVYGPVFTVDDPTELQNQAREEAMRKARDKAEAISEAGGFKLGKLVSVSEGVYVPLPIPYYAREVGGGGDGFGGGPSIEPGSQEVRVSVTLTYEIR